MTRCCGRSLRVWSEEGESGVTAGCWEVWVDRNKGQDETCRAVKGRLWSVWGGCVCVWEGGIVDCVKPMNKSVVSNSIWIRGGGGALQLHYWTDNGRSTDGRVKLKKVGALVKNHAAHEPHQAGSDRWSDLRDTAASHRLSSTEHAQTARVCLSQTPWCPAAFKTPDVGLIRLMWGGGSPICCFMKLSACVTAEPLSERSHDTPQPDPHPPPPIISELLSSGDHVN